MRHLNNILKTFAVIPLCLVFTTCAGSSDDDNNVIPPPATVKLEFFVKNAAGTGVEGATVTVEGQSASATTDATGAFTLSGLSGGTVFLKAAPPSGSSYLPTETREAVEVAEDGSLEHSVTLTFSSHPSDSAKYVGGAQCAACHSTQAADESASAHALSITADKSRMVSLDKWPAVGGTVDSKQKGLDPSDGTTEVAIVLCQKTAGAFSMKFGGTADCSVADGTLVPVSGTYGGEGDGGINSKTNFGKYKQRFLAKLADVPVAASWTYTAGKDKDFLILPVQVTQSGDGAPKFGGYHGNDWTSRKRTFSRACSGCHNGGLNIGIEQASGNNYIESYDYKDLNISCETCHGPGSEHVSASTDQKKITILTPRNLTAEAENQVCGACHSGDDGKSNNPSGAFGYGYNLANASKLGGGLFVSGVYDLKDYIKGFMVTSKDGGAFNAWPDGKHGKAHRQQYAMLSYSKHWANSEEKLTCASCHNVHTLYQGPKRLIEEVEDEEKNTEDEFVFESTTFKNNTLCLGCHAGTGPYSTLKKEDVAALHISSGGRVEKNGTTLAASAGSTTAVADAVKAHMKDKVPGMGTTYDPTNDAKPVGRCSSCHMARTAKSGGYLTGKDATGATALVAGDQASHVFDVIKFDTSSAMKKTSGGADTDIMPNACGACHANYLLSGD